MKLQGSISGIHFEGYPGNDAMLPGNCVASCLDAIRPLYDFYMVEKNKPIKSMSVWRLFQDSWESVT